jgi:glycosyltransferase involved in cell wall biosynthesis
LPEVTVLLPQFLSDHRGRGQEVFHTLLDWPDVTILAGKVMGSIGADTSVMEIPGGFRVWKRRRRTPSSEYHFDFYWGTPRILVELLRRQPDVIVTREFSYMTLYAIISTFFQNAQVIVLIESDRGTANPALLSLSIDKAKRRVLRVLSRRVDCFIAQDPGAQRFLIEDLGVPDERIRMRPWMVLANPFLGRLTQQDRHVVGLDVVLYVGQLIPRKGVDLLIRAFSLVQSQLKAELWLVGVGPQQTELENLARSVGMAESIKFLGRRSSEELGDIFAKASLFVFPTRSDYLGVAALEAMAAGVPVVTTNRTNLVPYYIEDGVSGYVFDPDEGPSGLAKVLGRALRDRTEIRRLAAEGQRRVAGLTDPQQAAAAIMEVAEEISSR